MPSLPGEDTAKPCCECLYRRANILTFVRNSYHYLTYGLETTLTCQKSEPTNEQKEMHQVL